MSLGDGIMKKNKIVAIILKVLAIIIILIGLWNLIEYRVWAPNAVTFHTYLKIFIPICTLGFSGTLYGIATLLEQIK